MRININGSSDSAAVVAGLLRKAGYVATQFASFAHYTLHIEDAASTAEYVLVDAVDSELERNVINAIASETALPVMLQRDGGVQSDREIRIFVPAGAQVDVEHGIFKGVLTTLHAASATPRIGIKSYIVPVLLAILIILLCVTKGHAQTQLLSPPATGMGNVDSSTLRVVLASDDLLSSTTTDGVGTPSRYIVEAAPADGGSWDNFHIDGAGNLRVSLPAGVAATVQGSTTTGASPCYIPATASTNSTICKNFAGNLFLISATNTATVTYYLRLYNVSAAPTCSSATNFLYSIAIPAAPAAGQAGQIVIPISLGEHFATGLGFCITGGAGSTDNTNAAAGVLVTLMYQ